VTIIAGIISKDCIVVASDSQTTCGGMKRMDAKKVGIVEFASDHHVLVGQGGNAGNSARAIEILSEMAKGKDITDYRTPADLARSAMLQVKQELRQQYCNCTMSELHDFIWKDELQSELMLAYYFDRQPYIFKLDLAVGRADKEVSHYAAIGCGANLGSYLLSEHTNPGMAFDLASVLAIYVVETVCKHDAYCSSPTQMGLIRPKHLSYKPYGRDSIAHNVSATLPGYFGEFSILEQHEIEEFVKVGTGVFDDSKQARNKKLHKLLRNRVRLALTVKDRGRNILTDYAK
jgi:20S proteasome alpha/beta subunit